MKFCTNCGQKLNEGSKFCTGCVVKIEFIDVTSELKAEIESFTHRFDTYSDFNFFSLYSWDTVSNRKISKLDNNLVVHCYIEASAMLCRRSLATVSGYVGQPAC